MTRHHMPRFCSTPRSASDSLQYLGIVWQGQCGTVLGPRAVAAVQVRLACPARWLRWRSLGRARGQRTLPSPEVVLHCTQKISTGRLLRRYYFSVPSGAGGRADQQASEHPRSCARPETHGADSALAPPVWCYRPRTGSGVLPHSAATHAEIARRGGRGTGRTERKERRGERLVQALIIITFRPPADGVDHCT